MIGQVNELWGQVEEIRRHRGTRQGGGEKDGWLSDERVLGEVAEVSFSRRYMKVSLLAGTVNSANGATEAERPGDECRIRCGCNAHLFRARIST